MSDQQTAARSATGTPALEARAVTKVFGEGAGAVRALRGGAGRVRDGEFVAIMGRSGSGKSTLLHILGGLDLPTGGRVMIDGVDTASLSDAQRATLRRERTSFIFQFFNLIPYLNAEDNIMLPNLLGGGQRGRDYRARLAE